MFLKCSLILTSIIQLIIDIFNSVISLNCDYIIIVTLTSYNFLIELCVTETLEINAQK